MKKHSIKIVNSCSLIIKQAQQDLVSPQLFYRLCRQLSQSKEKSKLYFLISDDDLKSITNVSLADLLIFFDYLAQYIRKFDQIGQETIFYLQPVLLKLKTKIIKKVIIKNQVNYESSKSVHISVKIVGAGMIGRVACIQINQGQLLAFKAFFDPDFVWLHGPWGEIPVGIYLQAHQVIKDIPEFKFGAENWAVWEWIDPETQPENREGIAYDEFAKKQGLTSLNTLNHNNYNHHQMRLDPGGIQKEYLGRRLENMFQGLFFYLRKIRREGILSLTHYLTWKNISYAGKRLIKLFVVNKENK